MRIASTVLDLIGDTPLVRLNHVTEGLSAQVVAKVEYLNPGGSVKDRIAVKIIDAAEASGDLRPGGTIVEPTSGNTGVGLALVAQQRGYRCVFVVPDKVGEDKRAVLRAYGAEVVVAPTAVAPDDPRSYYSVSDRLVREIPGAYKPNQYANPNGPASHYETTGPEIWDATDGRITHFVAGVGTGGTISGTGRYLKAASGGAVRIIGADPEGSRLLGRHRPPLPRRGRGRGLLAGRLRRPRRRRGRWRSPTRSRSGMTRRLAREEGLLVGGSSGMAVAAALASPASSGPTTSSWCCCPTAAAATSARSSTTTGCARTASGIAVEGTTVADLLEAKRARRRRPDLLRCAPGHRQRRDRRDAALRRLAAPVLVAEQPVVMGEVLGAVDERGLVDHAFSEAGDLRDRVGPSRDRGRR